VNVIQMSPVLLHCFTVFQGIVEVGIWTRSGPWRGGLYALLNFIAEIFYGLLYLGRVVFAKASCMDVVSLRFRQSIMSISFQLRRFGGSWAGAKTSIPFTNVLDTKVRLIVVS
jgi:hypothetical protein